MPYERFSFLLFFLSFSYVCFFLRLSFFFLCSFLCSDNNMFLLWKYCRQKGDNGITREQRIHLSHTLKAHKIRPFGIILICNDICLPFCHSFLLIHRRTCGNGTIDDTCHNSVVKPISYTCTGNKVVCTYGYLQ